MMKLALSFAQILVITTATCAADGTPAFKITSKRTDDRVCVKAENGSVVFDVRSPSGISSTTIERTAEEWPEKVVIQLRLKGLENFKASTDSLKIEASVSSPTGEVRLWKDGKEDSPLNSESPYWMEIRMIGSDGKPNQSIPLEDGYFQLRMPKIFFEDNPRSIQLHWIDFYRN